MSKISWVDKVYKRYKDTGNLIPEGQRRLYEKIRDEWAWGRTVVDIGCSIGIGSNILAHQARHVWGIDINEEALDFANRAYSRPNLTFAKLDIENPPTRPLASFEVLVMSEILEHLKEPETGLGVIKRFFIRKKGNTIGFITIPNINNEEVKKRDTENKLHLHRWTAGDFYALMTKHFEAVTMYSVDKLDKWLPEEMVDGNTKDGLIVAKVERPK